MGSWAADNDSGGSDFTLGQLNRVLLVLEVHRGRENAIARRDLSVAAQLDKQGRKLRAICRAIDLDPDLPLLGYDFDEGTIWECTTIVEAHRTDEWFRASAEAYLERLRGRQLKAAHATAAQPALFDLHRIPA